MSVKKARRILQRIVGGTDDLYEMFSEEFQKTKNEESEELYNAIIDVLVEHKATWQNTLAVIEMIRWSYLRAKYLQLVEGTVQIPEGNIPIPRAK